MKTGFSLGIMEVPQTMEAGRGSGFRSAILRCGDTAGAVGIFKLNAEQFPRDWNVFDSLGEALLKAGDKPHAIESYCKSLELNPENNNGREVLKSLGASVQ